MANQDANENKRIINITMNIELKNGESGEEYQEFVKTVTKDAIDAALTATKSINNGESGSPTANKEMARFRRSLDHKNLKNCKNKNANTSDTNTTESVYSGTKEETPKKERNDTNIETDKGAETEAMKKVRLSLQLKYSKKNKNDNSDATSSVAPSPRISETSEKHVTGAKNAKNPEKGTKITNENKDKPSIETEAMKKIRLSLELKNKSKLNKKNNGIGTTSTSSPPSSTRTCQGVDRTGNTKNPGKGIKRKVEDVGMVKSHMDTEGMKKIKLRNSRPNENYPNTRTGEITNEQMDIDDDHVSEHKKKQASPATRIGSRKTTQENKKVNVTKKVAVETEAMKMIRLRLEAKKNKNNNKNTATSTITSASISAGTPTGVIKDKELVKSPKPVKRKTATVDKPTEEMKIMKAVIEQRNKYLKSKPSIAATSSTTSRKTNTKTKISHEKKTHESVPISLTPIEISEDESDVTPAVPKTIEVNSEISNDENASRSSSRCSYQSLMSVDVEQPDHNVAATSTGRVTRSTTWGRRVWKK